MENKEQIFKIKEIENLLDKRIQPNQLAQIFRRLTYQANSMFMDLSDEDRVCYEKEWIIQGNYWLNEISEILDPNLTKNIAGE